MSLLRLLSHRDAGEQNNVIVSAIYYDIVAYITKVINLNSVDYKFALTSGSK